MNKPLVLALLIVSLPLFGMLASVFIGGGSGFLENVKYLFLPDIFSFFRRDRFWAEAMFRIWFVICAATVWSEYSLIEENMPGIFQWFEQWNYLFGSE